MHHVIKMSLCGLALLYSSDGYNVLSSYNENALSEATPKNSFVQWFTNI